MLMMDGIGKHRLFYMSVSISYVIKIKKKKFILIFLTKFRIKNQ